MELFFNELSLHPKANTPQEADNRILNFVQILNGLREHNFNIIRAHSNFFTEEIAPNYSLMNFINTPQKRLYKDILLSSIKRPYIPDSNGQDIETFILSEYSTLNHNNQKQVPEGLAAAHISSKPVVSFSSHQFWTQDYIAITFKVEGDNNTEEDKILNIYEQAALSRSFFIDWISTLKKKSPLNSEKNIKALFPEPKYCFSPQAIQDIIFWFHNDSRFINRIILLINDINNNPFTGGFGRTEILTNGQGKASKRIERKDRIIYTYTQEQITIHQCRGHYEDH